MDGWFGLGRPVLVWSQDDEHCNLIQIKTADFFHFALVASHYCFITKVVEVADRGGGLKSLDRSTERFVLPLDVVLHCYKKPKVVLKKVCINQFPGVTSWIAALRCYHDQPNFSRCFLQ